MANSVQESGLSVKCGAVTVECESFRGLEADGPCKGFAKVRFITPEGSIAVDNFRLIESKKGELFVASPSHKKGEKYFDDVEITGRLKDALNAAVKEAYEKSLGQ